MAKHLIAGLIMLMGTAATAEAREFYKAELSFRLTTVNVIDRVHRQLGAPVQAVYYFSDDGHVVLENGVPQRGLSLGYAPMANDSANGTLKAALHIDSVRAMIETILPPNSNAATIVHRARALGFLALSLPRIVPVELKFVGTSARSSVYQLHSTYDGEEQFSYHLVITATRPVRAQH